MGGGISAIKERLFRYVNTWGCGIWEDFDSTLRFIQAFGDNLNTLFETLYFDMVGCEGKLITVQDSITRIKPER